MGPKVAGHALARVIGASTTRCDNDFWPTDIGVKREFLTNWVFVSYNLQNKALRITLSELIMKAIYVHMMAYMKRHALS